MEKNTFPISTYIAAPNSLVSTYIRDLKNLDEWTLFSRMEKKINQDTWLGSASAHQTPLYYHIQKGSSHPFDSMEWHCGKEFENYYQVYPTYLIPPAYIEPGSNEKGVYFHWVSFIDPARTNKMLSLALNPIHLSEARSLKAVLEKKSGLTRPAASQYSIDSASIYIDAPINLAIAYLTDLNNIELWTHRLRFRTKSDAQSGNFIDEYGRPVHVSVRLHPQKNYIIIEQDTDYIKEGILIRSPMMLFPCSYVFSNRAASGFILHRITFWKKGHEPWQYGKQQIADYHAESINIKRLIEAKSGNFIAFANGPSYISK